MSMVQQTMSQSDGEVTITEEYPDGTVWELVYTDSPDWKLKIRLNGELRDLASVAEIYGALRNY